jgi:ribonuclease D
VTPPHSSADGYDLVTTESQLGALVDRLAAHSHVAFDTEFVSEHTYRSQLCLIQVAAPDTLAVIDTLKVRELEPFWRLLTEPGRTTVVHAGRVRCGGVGARTAKDSAVTR